MVISKKHHLFPLFSACADQPMYKVKTVKYYIRTRTCHLSILICHSPQNSKSGYKIHTMNDGLWQSLSIKLSPSANY